MEKKIVCFGDSNTWGYDPCSPLGEPYGRCWCRILAQQLNIENMGMNGRTAAGFRERIPQCALLILMLGTNDILQGRAPQHIVQDVEKLIAERRNQYPDQNLLLLAPPEIRIPGTEFSTQTAVLADEYEDLARRTGCLYGNPGRWDLSLAFDGVHLSQEGHRQFAECLLRLLHEKETQRLCADRSCR